MEPISFLSDSEQRTHEFADDFARNLKKGSLVALTGQLGAGKTVFARGLCRGLGFDGIVSSPSYTLVNIYQGRFRINHVDLYRIDLAEPGTLVIQTLAERLADSSTLDTRLALYRQQAGEPVEEAPLSAADKHVVIIGGGDTGSDCLGTSLRQGAADVVQLEIMPEPPVERPPETPWPEWPAIRRTSSSHKEGGQRRWSVTATEFVGEGGKVSALRGVEVDAKRSEDGRLRFEPKPGSEFEVPAELVLLSMGFVGPGPNPLADKLGVERDSRGNIHVDAHHMTSVDGVFAAGDVARGQSLVVRAIDDGVRAAGGIAAWLGKQA
jgi:tRNA threonylcarbamoyl adenosine modification protein YjeE